MTEKQLARLEFAKNSIEKYCENEIDEYSFIHRTAVIGNDGFGFARDVDGSLVKVNHSGNVVIEKYVVVRAYVTIDRAVNGSTFVGYGTKIDHHCHIAHGAKIGKWNTLANGCIVEGSCEIGDFNTFGAGVIVQRKVKIGNNCTFGSGAVVTKNVPDGETWVGNPASKLEKKSGLSLTLADFVDMTNDDLATQRLI